MRKLVVVTAFAAVAFTAQSAAACDWNREASTEQQQTATATVAPAQTQQAAPVTTQAPTVAAEATRKPAEEAAPVVLVNDHR